MLNRGANEKEYEREEPPSSLTLQGSRIDIGRIRQLRQVTWGGKFQKIQLVKPLRPSSLLRADFAHVA